jgi:putative glutamine amidotransferase
LILGVESGHGAKLLYADAMPVGDYTGGVEEHASDCVWFGNRCVAFGHLRLPTFEAFLRFRAAESFIVCGGFVRRMWESACGGVLRGANSCMPHLGSWIRECDEQLFGRFLAPHPEIKLSNARLGLVDPATLDGLLVTGGPDVSAAFHNEAPGDVGLIQDPEPERDAWEFVAVRSAYERGLPILTICKGVQVLNLALGGSLLLDIRGHNVPEMKSNNVQPLRYDTGAKHRFELVNSSHHQALDRRLPVGCGRPISSGARFALRTLV